MTTYTGIAALLPVFLIIITSLPWVRRRHYNLFYYSHVILGTLLFAASCIHASTDLYLLIPGLLLWFVDIFRRLFCGETGGLSRTVSVTLENADNGWIRITLPTSTKIKAATEKTLDSMRPLSYYYLNFPGTSKLQNHAFTAAIPGSTEHGPVFLLQRATGKKQKALRKEWTWKLGDLVPGPMDARSLKVRVEGPYPVNDSGFRTASHIVCIVGGTGITGAYSLARWWLNTASTGPHFTLIWTVRHREMVMVREWRELEEMAQTLPNMQVAAHISSENGRLNTLQALQQALGRNQWRDGPTEGFAWLYSSGPATLLSATERACLTARQDIHAGRRGRSTVAWAVQDISWYMARWEV